MATHSSTLAWETPGTEEPGGLQSMGSQGVRHDLATKHQLSTSPPRRSELRGSQPQDLPAAGHIRHQPSSSRRVQGKGPSGDGRGPSVAPPAVLLRLWLCPPVPHPSPASVDSGTLQSHHPQRQVNVSVAHPLKTHHLSPQGRSVYFRVRRGLKEESLQPCPVPDNVWTDQYIQLLCAEAHMQEGEAEGAASPLHLCLVWGPRTLPSPLGWLVLMCVLVGLTL